MNKFTRILSVWLVLLLFVSAATSATSGSQKASKTEAKGPFNLMFEAVEGGDYVVDVIADTKGRAKFGLLEKNASGMIQEVVTLRKKGEREGDIVELESRCVVVKSTLSPAGLKNYACPKEPQSFLMHRLNPFRIGLYPLYPVNVGDSWPYDVQLGQNGYIKANYKFMKLEGHIAQIDAVIDYQEEIPGMVITRSIINFKGKFWVDVTNSNPVRIEGYLKAKNQPTAKILSAVSFDVEANVKAALRSATVKSASGPRKPS
ncbi:MAG: hypothetical protein V2G42_01455 [bacterium JZ-2024 1]